MGQLEGPEFCMEKRISGETDYFPIFLLFYDVITAHTALGAFLFRPSCRPSLLSSTNFSLPVLLEADELLDLTYLHRRTRGWLPADKHRKGHNFWYKINGCSCSLMGRGRCGEIVDMKRLPPDELHRHQDSARTYTGTKSRITCFIIKPYISPRIFH